MCNKSPVLVSWPVCLSTFCVSVEAALLSFLPQFLIVWYVHTFHFMISTTCV